MTTGNLSTRPKPMLAREWRDRKVRLLRDIRTRGGETFDAGAVMEVVNNYRGTLELWAVPHTRNSDGGMSGIRKVALADVELLPIEA